MEPGRSSAAARANGSKLSRNDFGSAGFDSYFGYGRVHAAKAVATDATTRATDGAGNSTLSAAIFVKQ